MLSSPFYSTEKKRKRRQLKKSQLSQDPLSDWQKESDNLKDQITEMTSSIEKKETRWVNLIHKSAQALVDKIEIMRDLATYEVNFS